MNLNSPLDYLFVFVFVILSQTIVYQSLHILFRHEFYIPQVGFFASYAITNGVFYAIYRSGFEFQVYIRTIFLGAVFAFGVLVSILTPYSWSIFGWYVCFMAFFHFSEFLTAFAINPKTASTDLFMLNHSAMYGVAAVSSWIEYLIEQHYFPEIKDQWEFSIAGVLLCCVGEIIRKIAMITAHTNFNHIVQHVKEDGHVLITNGIYAICRHPAYVGWFFWAIGTQLILVNPLCIVLYAISSWLFFNDRVYVEELTLIEFFGYDYEEYKKEVPSGLPFISGPNWLIRKQF